MYPASNLNKDISECFESVQHLREEMTDNAMSMFGSGYVWLMRTMDYTNKVYLLNTYNSGSPFPGAHTRAQTRDAATSNSLTAGFIGDRSAYGAKYHEDAIIGQPILCLKLWEHQYMPDYGILGKEAYIRAWWNRIDWDQVQSNFNNVQKSADEGRYGRQMPLRERVNRPTPEGEQMLERMMR